MADTRRDVKVKLDIDLGDTNRKLDSLGRSLKSVANDIVQLERSGRSSSYVGSMGGGGGAGGPGGAGGTPAGGGTNRGLTGTVWDSLKRSFGGYGSMALGAATLASAMRSAHAVGLAINDPYQTVGGIDRAFRRSLPFGETLQGMADVYKGRTAAMEQIGVAARIAEAQRGIEGRYASRVFSMAPQMAYEQEYARRLGGASPITGGPTIDRSTAAGERQFRELQRQLPVRREIAESERKLAASSAARLNAEKNYKEITDKVGQLKREQLKVDREEIENRTGERGESFGPDRQKILERQRSINERLRQAQELQDQARGELRDRTNAEAQARAQTSQARARLHEVNADIFEERASTAATAATNLGMMNPLQRARAAAMFERLQQTQNPDALGPENLQAALSFGGPAAQKIVERFGAQTREFQRGKEVAPEVFGDPEQLRRQAQEQRDAAERERLSGQQQMAESIAKEGIAFGQDIAAIFKDLLKNAVNEIMNQFRLGKNAGA